MSSNGKPTIDRIDHGVLPSNDLGRAHRFYSTFMGGELDHLTNLTIRGLNREVPQILFYTLANHKGWGLALQDFPIASTPARPLDGVVYGFEVAADNLTDVVRAAEERKLKIHGPMSYAEPSPIKESLFVLDPDGNTLELSVRRDPIGDKPQGKIVPMRRISHVRVEVTDMGKPTEIGRGLHLKANRIVVGSQEQERNYGDRSAALPLVELTAEGKLSWSRISELGELVTGQAPGRTSRDEINIFRESQGGYGDMAFAAWLYEEAVKRGLGKKMDL